MINSIHPQAGVMFKIYFILIFHQTFNNFLSPKTL